MSCRALATSTAGTGSMCASNFADHHHPSSPLCSHFPTDYKIHPIDTKVFQRDPLGHQMGPR
jgi:hypothetical protein